jgi:putative tryptophan/tyrosine transport system substrate-binding protein
MISRNADRLNRRAFVLGAGTTGLGLVAGCGQWPWPAQAPAKVPRVGILNAIPSSAEALQQGLRGFGYVEGENIALDFRFVGAREDLLPEAAADLVRLAADVIVVGGDPGIRAAMEASATIPIVMAVSRDPVGSGFIASLARPGGSVTGLSFLSIQLAAKRLELLQQAVPQLTRVAVLGPPSTVPEWREVEAAGRTLGMQLQFLEVDSPDELARGLELAMNQRVEGLVVLASPLTVSQHRRIADLAAAHRLAAIFDRRELAEAGGLMAYGPNVSALWSRAGYYVDRVLRGTKPADLPVEQPMTFEFAVNLKTAQALGITFPNEIMLQVTEVIQ